MISLSRSLQTLSVLAAVAAAPLGALAQQTIYAIGNGGSTLVRFQSDNPGSVTVVGDFSGANTFLDAIDFRPATGQLYGYLDNGDAAFTVNTNTAQLTAASVGASGAPTNTFHLGMDFNPSIDRLRIITDSDQNIVFNPVAGTAAPFTNLVYNIGDQNENTDPNILDNAYSQNLPGAATTQQYAIDYGIDALVTLANNTGLLATVGSLGVNTSEFMGFDIYTSTGGIDTAYALLTTNAGGPGLYTINLSTGSATLVGSLGFTNQVYSLAVVPAIPAPSAAGLLGLSGLLMFKRRR